jgi:isopenicillin N synthase-like dioxygenase
MNILKVDYQSQNASEQFAQSLRETGFAVITNHPIEMAEIQEVYTLWAEFFNSEIKKDYLYNPKTQDGYFPIGMETAKGYSIADIKEFYHIYAQGRIPEFLRATTFELRAKMMGMSKNLLSWLQKETPEALRKVYDRPLPDMLSEDRTLYRILNYPGLTGSEQAGAIRAAAHEDINLITLLPAASENGLQVQDVNDNWHDVPCDYGSISINSGDMLDMASNGYFPSTSHRVINPEGAKTESARMSMPMFVHPKADVLLKPNFTANDFLTDRLKVIGLREEVKKS